MADTVVVVGAGPGGYVAAIRAASLGARVSLVERARPGGTCLHWGCIPTKALRTSALALDQARRLGEYGLKAGGEPSVDLAAVMARKNKIVDTQTKGLERLFAAWKVELIPGSARVLAPNRVEVASLDGPSLALDCDRLILAPGSMPADLPGLERDGQAVLNSDDVLNLTELPGSMIIVGGGVVGCELAYILSMFGCAVTLVEALDRLLPIPSLDPEISKLLLREMKKRKIAVHTGKVVSRLERGPDGVTAVLEPPPWTEPQEQPAEPIKLRADKVLVSVGRRPASASLDLAQAGLELDKDALVVDEYLSAAPGVFGVGDVLGAGRPLLAHMASAEGKVAAANALGGAEKVDYSVVPAVAFTAPEIAWVGLSPEQARERGIESGEASFLVRGLGMAQALGELAGVFKVIFEKKTGKLLGAHLMGAHSGEMVQECALALKMGATARDLAHTIHAHPTMSEALAETAEIALGECVHVLPPK